VRWLPFSKKVHHGGKRRHAQDFPWRIQNVQKRNPATPIAKVPSDMMAAPKNPAAAAAPAFSIFLSSTNICSLPFERHVAPRGPATPPMVTTRITQTVYPVNRSHRACLPIIESSSSKKSSETVGGFFGKRRTYRRRMRGSERIPPPVAPASTDDKIGARKMESGEGCTARRHTCPMTM